MNKQRMTTKQAALTTISCVLFFLLILAGPGRCLAVGYDPIKFKSMSAFPGAPQATVNCIFQDSRGFMWFGSQYGLHKYDGYHFTEYRYKPDDNNTPGNRVIQCIFEDPQGFLWIGTDNSLDRFDRGRETFSHFRPPLHEMAISTYNPVFTVLESPAFPGILWIGTMNGLFRFNKKDWSFSRDTLFDRLAVGQPVRLIRHIIESPRGILWLATNSGLYRYDLVKGQLSKYKNDFTNPNANTPNDTYFLLASKEEPGILWIATWLGLDRFDTNKETYIHFQHDPECLASLGHDSLLALCPSAIEKGVYWIGTHGGGLDKFDSLSGIFTHFKRNPNDLHSLGSDTVLSVYQDPSGVLWVGTLYSGLYQADRTGKSFNHYYSKPNTPEGLSDNLVFAICESREGVDNADNRDRLALPAPVPGTGSAAGKCPGSDSSNSADSITAPPEPGGIFWIGTSDGLNRFDRQSSIFTVYRKQPGVTGSLENNEIRRLYECPSLPGVIWIAYKNEGMSKFNSKNNTFTHYHYQQGKKNTMSPATVMAFHESLRHPGVLWLGTFGDGVYRFDIDREIFASFRFDSPGISYRDRNVIMSVYESPGAPGILWLATYSSGLIRFDTQGGTFRRYLTTGNTINSSSFFSIHESPALPGILWLASSRGLIRFDSRSGMPTAYRGTEQLLPYVIQRIIEDDQGNFWLSTDNGLLKFNPGSGAIKRYDKQDGLQSNEFSLAACRSRSGEMFFGGFDGFNCFFPQEIEDNPYVPPIVLTGFQVFNKPVKAGEVGRSGRVILEKNISEAKEINLSHEDKVFSFEFAALNYNLTSKNCYAYKMVGFDEDWIESGTQNSATYTGLPPNRYVFRVKGSNNDGTWNEDGISIRVIITPPWWRTSWAFALYAGILILLVVGLNRLQRALLISREQDKARIREAELRAQAAEAQAMAAEAENRRQTHELEEARKLQLSMLPHQVPDVPGFRIAVYMKMAQEVGGDYYDFYTPAQGQNDTAGDGDNAAAANDMLIAAVGDATGHGLKAGTMVSIMKGIFLNGDLELQQDTRFFFEKANRTIKRMHLENLFMALTVVKLQGSRGTIAAAGMPPIYRLSPAAGSGPGAAPAAPKKRAKKGKEGQVVESLAAARQGGGSSLAVEEIILKAPPLGAFHHFRYAGCDIELRRGEMLVLLSDGLPELFNPSGEMFGYRQVHEVLQKASGKTPQQIIDYLVETAENWAGDKAPDDDITFVVIEKT